MTLQAIGPTLAFVIAIALLLDARDAHAQAIAWTSVVQDFDGVFSAAHPLHDGGLVAAGVRGWAMPLHALATRLDRNGKVVWRRTYAPPGSSSWSGIDAVASGDGYLLLGGLGSPAALRIGGNGDSLWTRTYFSSESTTGRFVAADGTDDGGAHVIGLLIDTATRVMRHFIGRLDAQGTMLRTLVSPGFSDGRRRYYNDVTTLSDGGCVVLGSMSIDSVEHPLIVRLDRNGTLVDERVYLDSALKGSWMASVIELSDGDLLMSGSIGTSEDPRGIDAIAVRLGRAGAVEWINRTVGTENETVDQAIELAGGRFVLATRTSDRRFTGWTDLLVRTIRPNGTTISDTVHTFHYGHPWFNAATLLRSGRIALAGGFVELGGFGPMGMTPAVVTLVSAPASIFGTPTDEPQRQRTD